MSNPISHEKRKNIRYHAEMYQASGWGRRTLLELLDELDRLDPPPPEPSTTDSKEQP